MKDRSLQITQEQVRLLLYKECDWRGRKLLFDSSTIEKVVSEPCGKQSELSNVVENGDGFSYVYKGAAADSKLLGEMIFGAVAMNYKGVSLKIHIMDEPRRLMCTKVFCVPATRGGRIGGKRSVTNSSGDISHVSNPLHVPLQKEGLSLNFSLERGDSGFYGDASPQGSIDSTCDFFSMYDVWDTNSFQDESSYSFSGRKLSTTSNDSWQRRTFQNIATRFDMRRHSTNLLSVPVASNGSNSDSTLYSNSSVSGTCESINSAGTSVTSRKNKLGLALLITVTDSTKTDLFRRCVENSPQLHALVCRLRVATLAAGSGGGKGFVATLYRAAGDAANWLSDLMYGPRLQPIWLHLGSAQAQVANKLAEKLLSDLCFVLTVGDTKDTNFFISTLITYVLTYHLGWVTTVSPYDTVDLRKTSSDCTEPKRPYNALWAQLSDLCGSIGFPPRSARTIISGSNNIKFINRLLEVLTYFVRCGDVKQSDFSFEGCVLQEKVISVKNKCCKRTPSVNSLDNTSILQVNTQENQASALVSDVSFKRTSTLANLNTLSISPESVPGISSATDKPTCGLKRNPSIMIPNISSDSSPQSSFCDDVEVDKKVVFVLGDNEKLVGLKNKSIGGRRVKKSSKVQNEPLHIETQVTKSEAITKESCDLGTHRRDTESPSKCCNQTLQHSKPIKHSGFKFEFDKYPNIVTNYMKSKNLEILDRHYIGKPGNLKLDNFQFDPTIVPLIQEEKCETCYKCQLMESMLQTPTNASELEFMNDMPRQSEPQYAKETIVEYEVPQISPKNFIRKRKENTIVVNKKYFQMDNCAKTSSNVSDTNSEQRINKRSLPEVKRVIEIPLSCICLKRTTDQVRSGFGGTLLGGLTNHYVPDLILQGTTATPATFEADLRRDIELTAYLTQPLEAPVQAVAIVGDTNTWQVQVSGRSSGATGMSALVGDMLDALPIMWGAKVPAHQCLSFLEGKLRELCILSKTLADMLMSTDFCDIATLTKSLNIEVNDVPLLLAVATTHSPQVARRYGISCR